MEHISLLYIRSGINKHTRKSGNFQVLHTAGIEPFTKFLEAVKFYNQLQGEASFWDVTEKAKLLEAKVELDRKIVNVLSETASISGNPYKFFRESELGVL